MAERQAVADGESTASLEQAKVVAKESGSEQLIREARFLELYEAVYRPLLEDDLLELEVLADSVDETHIVSEFWTCKCTMRCSTKPVPQVGWETIGMLLESLNGAGVPVNMGAREITFEVIDVRQGS